MVEIGLTPCAPLPPGSAILDRNLVNCRSNEENVKRVFPKDGDLIIFLDAQRWCQVHCEAVEVFEDLPPVYRWIELLW